MSKREDQRFQATERISRYVLKEGLAQTSLRQLADAAEVSDRMLLYYFENKADVMTEVLRRIVFDLANRLAASLPADEKLSPADLLEKGAALTSGRTLKSYMQISVEIFAAAGRKEEPYAGISTEMIEGFLAWVEQRLTTTDPRQRRAEAALILTAIDGSTLLQISGKKSEAKAAIKTMIAALRH